MPVPANEIQLSILVLSIPSRIEKITSLISNLEKQLKDRRSVEILVLTDNRSQTISEKRNVLLRAARGKFICFLDDDDCVSNDYIDKLLTAISENSTVDCISFNQFCNIDGEPMTVNFGIGNPHSGLYRDEEGFLTDIKRPPYHMCVWKRRIAQSEQFNPMLGANGQSYGEDLDWLMRLYPKIQTEHNIEDTLHNYIYNSNTTTSLVPQSST